MCAEFLVMVKSAGIEGMGKVGLRCNPIWFIGSLVRRCATVASLLS